MVDHTDTFNNITGRPETILLYTTTTVFVYIRYIDIIPYPINTEATKKGKG